MKKIFILVGVLTFIVGCNQPNIEQDKSNAEAAIIGFYSAAEKFDYATMRTFCTPNFHAIENGHTYNNLDEFLEIMKKMEDFTGQIKLDIIKTDTGKDMAMSIVKFNVQFKNEETQMNFKTIENYSLKKVDEKWLIDFFQSTYLTEVDNNKEVAAKYHELKADNIDAILTKDFIGRDEQNRRTWNIENHKKFLTNGVYKKDSIFHQIAEGDWVATRFVRRMDWNGKRVKVEAMQFKRFKNEKIAEIWEYADTKQLDDPEK